MQACPDALPADRTAGQMTSRASQLFVLVRGVCVAALFVLLWSWLASLVRRYDPALGLVLPDWLRPLGYVLAAVGGLLAASCVAAFIFRGQGTPAPFDPP